MQRDVTWASLSSLEESQPLKIPHNFWTVDNNVGGEYSQFVLVSRETKNKAIFNFRLNSKYQSRAFAKLMTHELEKNMLIVLDR